MRQTRRICPLACPVSDGVLFPWRKSTQNATETSLVSDFPFFGAGSCSASEGEKFRQLFLPPRSFSSNFACRPSPPYIAKLVFRFRFHRLAKLCSGELHLQSKALRRKGRYSFSQPQERASGANDSSIRYPRAENRTERSLCTP